MPSDHLLCSYTQALEEATDITALHYIGPRAIFDANFLPPVFFPRRNIALHCYGILSDALSDHYATNLNLYGLKGTGKNLLLNHLLRWTIQHTIPKRAHRREVEPLHFLRIDCTEKEADQIFFQILFELGSQINLQFDIEQLQTYTSGLLWNTFKMLVQKIHEPILLFFQGSEALDSCYLAKLYAFAREVHHLQIITSVNTRIPNSPLHPTEGMDHLLHVTEYSMTELQAITHQRSIMTFPTPICKSGLDLLVDYAGEFEAQTPGACINLLKVCHPQILDTRDLTPEMLRLASQYHFEGAEMNIVSLMDFVSETSFEDRCFLEFLVNYFRDQSKFYMPFTDVKKMYKMSCEELSMAPTQEEFFTSFTKICRSQILRPSLFQITPNTHKMHGIYPVSYYLTVPLNEINEVMDVAFGMIGNENQL